MVTQLSWKVMKTSHQHKNTYYALLITAESIFKNCNENFYHKVCNRITFQATIPIQLTENFIALILYLKFRCINMSAICVKAFSVCAVGHEYFLVNATMVTIHA